MTKKKKPAPRPPARSSPAMKRSRVTPTGVTAPGAQLVIVDDDDNVVQTWQGDVDQAAEIRRNLPAGRRVRE
jgi:hypothetical protein